MHTRGQYWKKEIGYQWCTFTVWSCDSVLDHRHESVILAFSTGSQGNGVALPVVLDHWHARVNLVKEVCVYMLTMP